MVKRTAIIMWRNVACPRNDLAWSQLAQCLTHACPALAHTFVHIPDMHAHECLCRFAVFLHSHALVVDATATSIHYFLHTLQQSSTKAVHVIVLVYVLADSTQSRPVLSFRLRPRILRLRHFLSEHGCRKKECPRLGPHRYCEGEK